MKLEFAKYSLSEGVGLSQLLCQFLGFQQHFQYQSQAKPAESKVHASFRNYPSELSESGSARFEF